VFLFPCQAY